MKITKILMCLVLSVILFDNTRGQSEVDSLVGAIIDKPNEYVHSAEQKIVKIQNDFESKLNKKKAKLIQEEQRLYKLISKTDSSLGNFSKKLLTSGFPKNGRGYIPVLDSLGTSFNFMKSLGLSNNEQLESGLKALENAQKSLAQADLFQEQFSQRLDLLKDKLLSMRKFKELQKLQEKFYYYTQQVDEYRSMLNKPDVIIAKSLQILQKSKLFKDFFARNSQLSSLFAIPGTSGTIDPASLTGLQTISTLQSALQQRFGVSGAALQSQVQAPSPNVQQLVSQLQDKISIKSAGEPEALPNFRPNPMKNKSVWQRIEFGTNVQAQRAGVFPTTMDFAATAAYQLSKKNSFGIGASYKLGLGEVFKDVKISHQGIGLRSFLEIKWKNNLFIAGGYEMNYRSEIHNLNTLKDLTAWQKSSLIGLNRKFKAGNKLTANCQLLWDFLSYMQVPKAQPFIFRFGYTFNK